MQPLHATEDMNFAETRMGSERLKYVYTRPVQAGN